MAEESTKEREPLTLQKRIILLVTRHTGLFSVVVFLFGLLWVCLFPLVCITTGELKCRGTYMSENALMPGSAFAGVKKGHITFADASDVNMFNAFKSNKFENPEEIISSQLYESGATHIMVHNYSESTLDRMGKMVVGVLRPKNSGDRREAIILVTSFPEYLKHKHKNDYNFKETTCCSGLAVLLALTKFNSEVPWLSKNLIIVAAETELGVHKFMEYYHSRETDLAVQIQGGRLAAGIALHLARPKIGTSIQKLAFATQGINGQLPNLDLLNVAVRVSKLPRLLDVREGTDVFTSLKDDILTKILEYVPSKYHHGVKLYAFQMETLIRFMYRIAFVPSGRHVHLLPYRVDALSLVGIEAPSKQSPNFDDIQRVAETVQSIIRSLSNLDEKLHQSYYLYLIPDPNLFVSINEYSGALVCVMMPIVLNCIVLIVPLDKDPNSRHTVFSIAMFSFAFAMLLLMLAFGAIMFETSSMAELLSLDLGFALPDKGIQMRKTENPYCNHLINTSVLWLISLILAILGFVFLVIPSIRNYMLEKTKHESSDTELWKYAKVSLLFYMFVFYVNVGVLNFPFMFLYAVCTVPFYCFVSPSKNKQVVRKLALVVWWVMTSPISAVVIFSKFAMSEEFWNSVENTGCSTLDPYPDLLRGVMMMQASYWKYETFHFPFLCFVHVPLHVVSLWILLSLGPNFKTKRE